MKYLVMETHPAYAVVLDNEGRFLKAANLHYQVGDTVERIVELRPPREKTASLWKPLVGLTGKSIWDDETESKRNSCNLAWF